MALDIENILADFNKIFIEVLDEEDIVLAHATTADDIDEWDSLTHLQLVVAIEKHFNVKFTSLEIESYENVGQMCQGVAQKLA